MIKTNRRMTAKERGLLKGAIRRVFSRSELRKAAISKVSIPYSDPSRPRVKKWSGCLGCGRPTPQYLMQVDHIEPIIPVLTTLEDMTWDQVINNTWCDPSKLQAICKECHLTKTKEERKLRNKRSKK